MWEVEGEGVGEDGSFLRELLKIERGNQIRSIKIRCVAEWNRTGNSTRATNTKAAKQ